MNKIKRIIFRTEDSDVAPSPPPSSNVVIQWINETECYSEMQIRVNTNVMIKVNITSTFTSPASYADTSYLTGNNKKTANLVDEVITELTLYNFGIDASKHPTTNPLTSSITISIRDFTTNDLIDSKTLTRNHINAIC